MEKDETKLLKFADDLISVTMQLGKQYEKELTREQAFDIAQNIVANNYPKCAVKYITGQDWMI